MPTLPQVESLLSLLETKTAITVIETHEERRVMALFEAVARRTQREVWTWSVSQGLRAAHGLKLKLLDFEQSSPADTNATKELPDALRQVGRMHEPALVVLLDIHPYLSNPVVTRALKELALQCETSGRQLVFVGHDITLPDELAPHASRFEVEAMTLERVKALFNEELQRRRNRSGQDVAGARATLDSLLRHMVAMPEAAVRHLVRLTLGDGQVTAADLASVLSAKQASLGVAELLVFEQNPPSMDDVAGMRALKR